jgi:hypothetical protein
VRREGSGLCLFAKRLENGGFHWPAIEDGTIKLSGPFVASPKVTLDLEGLDFDVPLSQIEEPVRLTLAEVHGDIDLVNEQGSIDRTKALVRGGKEPGEVMVGATFQSNSVNPR